MDIQNERHSEHERNMEIARPEETETEERKE